MSGWVSFDDGGDSSDQEPVTLSKRQQSTEKAQKTSWVKFEESLPKVGDGNIGGRGTPTTTPASHRPLVPQHTGDSVHSGGDVLSQESDDRHSVVASSVISSRGSFSGSHDNISSSREYMPLESTSPKQVALTAPSEGWAQFGDSARPIINSTPRKTTTERQGKQNGSLEHSRVSSPVTANWVQFEEDNDANLSSASSRPSPSLSPSIDGSLRIDSPVGHSTVLDKKKPEGIALHKEARPTGTAVNTAEKGESSVASGQTRAHLPRTNATPIHMSDHAHDLEVSQYSAVASVSDAQREPASPGNPFKADVMMLQQLEKERAMALQVQRTISPFNPFINTGVSGPDKTPVKNNISKTWATFDEADGGTAQSPALSTSVGNPFAHMTVAANVHNRPPMVQPFTPQNQIQQLQQQHLQEQAIYAAAAAAQQSSAISQPVRQIMAVQPLPQANAAPLSPDQRTSALLSPDGFASQPISPISMKPNQWSQQEQQFYPTPSSPPHTYPKQTYMANPSNKPTLAAIVSPTPSDKGKFLSSTRTSIKSNLSSPTSEKIPTFLDKYPREQVDPSEGWPLKLRCPDKKKIAGARYWIPVHVRLSEGNVLQLFHDKTRKEPFRELPLQCNYELGLQGLQQFDIRGKIHTIKLLYLSYKERRKMSAKPSYEKQARLEQLMKLGSLDFNVFKSFVIAVTDALMKLTLYKDRGSHYQQDMISVVVSDECRCFIDEKGDVEKQSVVVSVNILSFLSGSPDCALGLNDAQVKGLDVVARQHIIPNKTSDWIQLHNVELHKRANKNIFADSRMIEFQPLNACRFRLMQFHVAPSEEESLPLQVKAALSGEGVHLEMRVDLLVPACQGKRNAVHFTCENIQVRVPIPDQWIFYFRKPRRMGQSSIHAEIKKPDVIKRGCLNPKLLEISVGTAKYEHAYRAVVWRIDKLPEKTSGHPVTHILKCHMNLVNTSEVRGPFSRPVEVEYHTPHTTASKTTVRSLAVSTERSPDKRIRYMAAYDYQVQIEDNYIWHSETDDDSPSACLQQ